MSAATRSRCAPYDALYVPRDARLRGHRSGRRLRSRRDLGAGGDQISRAVRRLRRRAEGPGAALQRRRRRLAPRTEHPSRQERRRPDASWPASRSASRATGRRGRRTSTPARRGGVPLHRHAAPRVRRAAGLHNEQEPELATIVREGDVVLMPQGYHPNVAAPGGSINFLWMMAANREQDDRLFGVVNVHPDFSGRRRPASTPAAPSGDRPGAFDSVRPRRAGHRRLARPRRGDGDERSRRPAPTSRCTPARASRRAIAGASASRSPHAAARRAICAIAPAPTASSPRLERFGGLDILVNNAGIIRARRTPSEHSRRGLGRRPRSQSDQRLPPLPRRRPTHAATAAAARSSTSRRCCRFRAASACPPTPPPRAASRS